ncbi:hypothetical protein AKO1_001609, partial [Acrasis kona]
NATKEHIPYDEKWLTLPEKAAHVQKVYDRVHELDTLVNYELNNLPNDRKTYVLKGNIYFLNPLEQVKEESGKELQKMHSTLKKDQDDLYKLQHSFQLYRQQESANK